MIKIAAQDYADECPTHAAPLVREYTFGMNDATVGKHKCGCCVVWGEDGLADGLLFDNYPAAAGCARLTVAKSAAADAYFS